MTAPVDFEIGLQWRPDANGFDVSLRFSDPEADYDLRFPAGSLRLDLERLAALVDDEEAYGRLLSESLFGLPETASVFASAQARAASAGEHLRLRLLMDPAAPSAVHAVLWETLRDPRDGYPIATKRNVAFSRHLSSAVWAPMSVPPKHKLTTLVAVANPTDLLDWAPGGRTLFPVDVQGELARAEAALGVHRVTLLTSERGVTLGNIAAEFQRDDGHDVLYLVCHGAVIHGETVLYLERPDSRVAATRGDELVECLGHLDRRPALVVLSACQTAAIGDMTSSRDDGALATLGPRLATAGIAAVVAMQGNITRRTAASVLPAFFDELKQHGVVDVAMAAARQAAYIDHRADWWVPVLFMRPRSGRIWYSPEVESPRQVQLRVFLCHSSSDKASVRRLYRSLRADDMSPWLDEEDLLPGQDWDREIRDAIRASHAVLVCLSKRSINKVGYVQKEIKEVLDRADEQPDGTIFLIPIRLEPLEVPERIRRWQWVDLFEEGGYGRLMRALRHRAASLPAGE